MINVADLLQETQPGNYFAPDAYIQGDFESGLIENRQGDRLLALPETFVRAIYLGLEKELGQASGIVLTNCGRWWGKNFYARFMQEVSDYYGKTLAQMDMVEFLQCLKQCWKTHGWGTFELDVDYYQQGFLIAKICNSPFAAAVSQNSKPACFLEAGILGAFFTQLTGRELDCVQISCETLGADCNRFVLGLPHRLKSVAALLEEKQDYVAILNQLTQ